MNKSLVLSGGGSKGAFQAGCLYHIIGRLGTKYYSYHGVSVGAINCAFLAQFYDDEAKEAAIKLRDLWLGLNNKDIYKRWSPFGRFHVLHKLGFYDSSPLRRLIENNISLERIRAVGKQVKIGLVSMTSGKYTTFDQTSDNFIDAVYASASFPVMFEPVKIGDEWWSDGGVKTINPTSVAIEMGATEIDAIVTSPAVRDKKFLSKLSILDIMNRSFDLYTEKIMSNDIERAIMYNKLADAGLVGVGKLKLNIIRPRFNLVEDIFDFSPAIIRDMFDIGYKDVKELYRK
jgi:NTE family protein